MTIERKPPWLRIKIPSGEAVKSIRANLKKHRLNTVCEEARCPNIGECWGCGHATIMVLGDICTRNCAFCAVKHSMRGRTLDPNEPVRVSDAIKKSDLKYVVITSVTRDDLPDFGAGHYASVIKAIKNSCKEILVEALIPDYTGKNLKTVLSAKPFVLAHNIETVSRLVPVIRDKRANYKKSLSVLKEAKRLEIITKSSLLLGLGESKEEIIETFRDLRKAHVDIVTLGQYLSPSIRNAPVVRYVHPSEFDYYRKVGLELGFKRVFSGPLVRSSYRASEALL